MAWLRKNAEALLRNPLYAAAFAALCMFMPFMAWLGWGWLVLATLRYGYRYCAYVSVGATLGIIVLVGLLEGAWSLAWFNIGVFIIPLALFALLLRQSVSMNFTLQCVAIAILVLLLIADFFQVMTPTAISTFLKCRFEQVITTDPTVAQNLDVFAEQFAWSWPTGLFWVYVFGLFLGRWFQAALDNPGGFKREFYSLRLNFWIGCAAFIIIALSFVLPPSVLLIATVGLTLNVLVLFGLSLVYKWVEAKNWSKWIIVGVYILLLLLPVVALPALSMLAVIDSVADLRKKLV